LRAGDAAPFSEARGHSPSPDAAAPLPPPAARAEPKTFYAEFVSLTDGERDALVCELGEADAERAVDILNNYKGAHGKQYRSDYLAIRHWVLERLRTEQPGGAAGPKARWAPEEPVYNIPDWGR
jgi:hypothetical protein